MAEVGALLCDMSVRTLISLTVYYNFPLSNKVRMEMIQRSNASSMNNILAGPSLC